MISQTVSPIACCGGYKHVVLLQFPVTKASDHHTWVNYNQLFQSLVVDSSMVKVRSLSPRKFGPFNLIPVIVRARGGETVDRVVKTLRKVEGNVAVEKVVYSNDPVRPNPVAVLFLSLFEASAQPSTSQN